MLGNIKSMIQEKMALQESAEVRFEDARGMSLDDMIVLGEDADVGTTPTTGYEEGDECDKCGDPECNGECEDKEENDTDILDTPIDDAGSMSQSDVDELGDILNIEINLASNTPTDTLPVPPKNAQDAVTDDILNTPIDDQPAETTTTDPEDSAPVPIPSEDDNKPSEATEKEETDESVDNDIFSEAISIGDDESPSEDTDTSTDTTSGDSGKENQVTAAVRDKVNETEVPDADMGVSDDAVSDSNDSVDNNKDAILKKLSSITKNIEDAKQAVMNSIKT